MEAMTAPKPLTHAPLLLFPPKTGTPRATPPVPSLPNDKSRPPSPTIALEVTKQLHAHLIRTHYSQSATVLHCTTPAARLNSLITSYVSNGRPSDACAVYAHVRNSGGGYLDSFTVPSILKACGLLTQLQRGREVHGYALKSGLNSDVFVLNALVQMYSECGNIASARDVFDEMPDRDHVSWSTMLQCYRKSRLFTEAFDVVREMLALPSEPSEVAMLNMIGLFSDIGAIELAREMHACLVKSKGAELGGIGLSTALVDMYVKCGSTDAARRIFEMMSERNVVSWTSMISGYVRAENFKEGMKLFVQMQEEGIDPNEITMLSLVIECGMTGAKELGKRMHSFIVKKGFLTSIVLATALVDMYAKCGEIESARSLFDEMSDRDVATWTAMISGYAKNGSLNEAVVLFGLMKSERVKPNEMTVVTLLQACAEAGALDLGKWIHAFIDRLGIYDLVLTTALVDMYAKCGDIDGAYKIFSEAKNRDVCMWNAMICGFSLHGCGKEALELFSLMEEERIAPNNITCIGILHACSHAGLVEQGKLLYERMECDFGLKPELEHYGCMVDLLSRAGLLEEAYNLINSLPVRPNMAIWGALLAGCKLHKNAKLGEEAARNLLVLEPQNCGYQVLLSNMYAVNSRWSEVAEVRRIMNDTGIKKAPGLSSIEVNGALHEFATGDDSHPQAKRIQDMISEMVKRLRCAGHTPVTSASLLNADEEEREASLCYHSEKLAIAFGLISTAPHTPIRIVKNLRVCDDCHAATKLLSKIYGRLIVVRDRNRFHHFRGGSCSCGDYW